MNNQSPLELTDEQQQALDAGGGIVRGPGWLLLRTDDQSEPENPSAQTSRESQDSANSTEASTNSSEDWYTDTTEETLGTAFGITRGTRSVRPSDLERELREESAERE